MNFSNRDVQTMLFTLETLLGVCLLAAAWHVWQQFQTSGDPSYLITAIVLVTVGLGLIIFGVDTYLLRDDPEIWR